MSIDDININEISVLDISIHDEFDLGMNENDIWCYIKLVYKYEGEVKFAISKIEQSRVLLNQVTIIDSEIDIKTYNFYYTQAQIDNEFGLRDADVKSTMSTKKYKYDYLCGSDDNIDNYTGPTYYQNTYDFRDDDPIVNIVPKDLFFTVGEHQYNGIEYGFIIDTKAVYSYTGELTYNSTVGVYDIEAYRNQSFNDGYKYGNHFQAKFAYNYTSFVKQNNSWSNQYYNKRIDKIVFGSNQKQFYYLDNLIVNTKTGNSQTKIRSEICGLKYNLELKDQTTGEKGYKRVLSMTFDYANTFIFKIPYIGTVKQILTDAYDIYKAFEAIKDSDDYNKFLAKEDIATNMNNLNEYLRNCYGDGISIKPTITTFYQNTDLYTREFKENSTQTFAMIAYTNSVLALKDIAEAPSNIGDVKLYFECDLMKNETYTTNIINLDSVFMFHIGDKMYPTRVIQNDILISGSSETSLPQSCTNTNFSLNASNNYQASFTVTGNGSNINLKTISNNMNLIYNPLTVRVYRVNDERDGYIIFSGSEDNNLVQNMNASKLIYFENNVQYRIEIQELKNVNISGQLCFENVNSNTIFSLHSQQYYIPSNDSSILFAFHNNTGATLAYITYNTFGAYNSNGKVTSIEVFDSSFSRIGYNTLGLYDEEADDPNMSAYLSNLPLKRDEKYYIRISVSSNFYGEYVMFDNDREYWS